MLSRASAEVQHLDQDRMVLVDSLLFAATSYFSLQLLIMPQKRFVFDPITPFGPL